MMWGEEGTAGLREVGFILIVGGATLEAAIPAWSIPLASVVITIQNIPV